MAHTYTKKIVNGVLTSVTAGDVTTLHARDAADWERDPPVALMSGTTGERVARLLKANGLTLAEFKTVLGI